MLSDILSFLTFLASLPYLIISLCLVLIDSAFKLFMLGFFLWVIWILISDFFSSLRQKLGRFFPLLIFSLIVTVLIFLYFLFRLLA